jgi:myo-inositol 2-dehydrogenase/D-chiro-inositol 1-dehydrogenase
VVTLHHAGGAVSHLAGEWGGPDVAFATAFVLTGTRGTIGDRSDGEDTGDADDTDDTGDSAGGAADGEGGGVLPAWQSDDSPYLAQAAEFLAALRGGPAPRVSAADGVAAVAIAQAANLSASDGRPVSVPDPSGRVPHGGL